MKKLACLVLLLFAVRVGAIGTLATVHAWGTTIDGWTVLCSGSGCSNYLLGVGGTPYHTNQPEMGEGGGGDLSVTKGQFCAALKSQKPSGCSLASPPPSPGIVIPGKPAWKANGCGTGPLSNVFLDAALTLSSSQSYSGNLDAPYTGVNFLSACNAHDRCYAMAGGKQACDTQFNSAMETACGAAGANCIAWAHAYHGAVGVTNAAQSAYNQAEAGRVCALWAKDMRTNQCQ